MTDFNNYNLNEAGVYLRGGQFTPMAMDSALGTNPTAGLPSIFTTAIDPEIVEYLFQPTPLATAFSEVQRGDWTTTQYMFGVVEGAGNPTAYGDWEENSSTGVNAEFIERQPFTYQEIIRVGEKEQDTYGKALISMANEKQKWCVDSLNRRQHQTYIYGVSGLKNWGLLNDPSLQPVIQGSAWGGDPNKAYLDFQKLYGAVVDQTEGLVDETSQFVLLVTPQARAALLSVNSFMAKTTLELIKDIYPNITVVSVPQYRTDSGDYMQLICPQYNGSDNVQLAYNTKMRVHNIVLGHSGFSQKRTQGSYGAVIKRPAFIATMLTSVANESTQSASQSA